MSDSELVIVSMTCQVSVEQCSGGLKEKLLASMKSAKDHWMVEDKDKQFHGALAAVMTHYGIASPEYQRIKTEIDGLQQLTAFINAMQVGLSVELPKKQDGFEPLGLMKMWRKVNKDAA